MSGKRAYWAAAIAGLLMAPGFGVGPSFIPDTSFKGADWHAQNGEIISVMDDNSTQNET